MARGLRSVGRTVAERVEQELAARAADIALTQLQHMTRQAKEGATAEQR